MTKVWKLGAAKTFQEFVVLATKKKLSSQSYINNVTLGMDKTLRLAKKRIKRMGSVPRHNKPIQLNAEIQIVDGKKEICSNKKSFAEMAEKYKEWLEK